MHTYIHTHIHTHTRIYDCDTIIYHKRISDALKNMIGRDGFRGANQNTECIHDSQWEGYILFSVNLAYTCTNVYVHFTIYI